MTETTTQPNTVRVALDRAEVLRNAFRGNEEILKSMRALFFGFPMTDTEKGSITALLKGKHELQLAVRNKIFSKLSKDTPIGSNPDFWVGTEEQIQGQHPDTVKQILGAKHSCLEMLESAMQLLEDVEAIKVEHVVEYNPKLLADDPMGVALIARNLYIKSIENGLMYIKLIADMSDEDMKKVAESRKKDSTK